MSRFDYVAYDLQAQHTQAYFKTLVQQVEFCVIKGSGESIDEFVTLLASAVKVKLPPAGRPTAIALEKLHTFKATIDAFIGGGFAPEKMHDQAIDLLEEFYMWVGKAIRDDQIARNGSAPLQEGRKNG